MIAVELFEATTMSPLPPTMILPVPESVNAPLFEPRSSIDALLATLIAVLFVVTLLPSTSSIVTLTVYVPTAV